MNKDILLMDVTKPALNVQEIQQLIPHRYPFLLVDKVYNIDGDVQAVGVKSVTINEGFFQGHFPGRPIMPGVLIIEAMAQTSGIIVVHSLRMLEKIKASEAQKIVYFMSVEEARFRKPVVPGDTLLIAVEKIKSRSAVWKYRSEVFVGGQVVAEALYTAMVAD